VKQECAMRKKGFPERLDVLIDVSENKLSILKKVCSWSPFGLMMQEFNREAKYIGNEIKLITDVTQSSG